MQTIRVPNFVYIHPPVLELSPNPPVFDVSTVFDDLSGFLQLGVVRETSDMCLFYYIFLYMYRIFCQHYALFFN